MSSKADVVRSLACWLGVVVLGAALLGGCDDCADTADEWKALVQRADVLACTADVECLLVGQTSTCDCSRSMAGDGVAVNGAAYSAAGGDGMLERFVQSCHAKMPVYCCDCAPMSDTGCVNGRCKIVRHGCCGGCKRDGGQPWSQADVGTRSAVDVASDVPASLYDAY